MTGNDGTDLVARVTAALHAYGLDHRSVMDWFATPNRWLGGVAPAEAVRAGDAEGVEWTTAST